MLKALFVLHMGLLGGLALAKSALDSAKSDPSPASTAASAGGSFPLIQLVIVAAILFLVLKVMGPKALSFLGSRVSTPVGSSIKVETSATLAQGALYVVNVRGKTLLLGATTGSVSLLADLTEAEAALKAEPAFFEELDAAVVELEPVSAAAITEDESPLSRLDRLMGRSA